MSDTPIGRFMLPADMPPPCSNFAGSVVMGYSYDGRELKLEQRLPFGEPFNPQNPAHLLGWFMCRAAPDLMRHAQEAYRIAEMRRAPNPTAIIEVAS